MKLFKSDRGLSVAEMTKRQEIEEKIKEYKAKGYRVPARKIIKTETQIEGIRKSAVINTAVLDLVAREIHAGMTTEEINTLVHHYTIEQGAIPAPLNYEGFPKSVCTSVNDEVCHGIPSANVVLQEGDIVNVDVSTILDGYYSDASRMFMIGRVRPETENLVRVARECLERGFEAAQPWGFLGDVSAAVQEHAEANGYSVVREFGGHGVGIRFHEDPFVSHIGKRGTGILLVPGMVFTIEPMINMGKRHIFIDADNDWTVLTHDGLPSAQWEYTVLITEKGPEIITG